MNIDPEELAKILSIRIFIIDIDNMKRVGNNFYPTQVTQKGNVFYFYGEQNEK